jgi:hypothetical protein
MSSCDDIDKALAEYLRCEQTGAGARIATHCLYPSFETVKVFVAKMGDSYDVHDGMGAYNTAWLHGRDEAMIMNSIRDFVARFHLTLNVRTIVGRAASIDWLPNAIISVANASALAAHDAVAKMVAAAEQALVDRIAHDLAESVGPKGYDTDIDIRGVSGGLRHFDFIIGRTRPQSIFINAILAHQNSINSKYVSFADTEADKRLKWAVHDHPLDNDDILLLQQVASVVPFTSMRAGMQRLRGQGFLN